MERDQASKFINDLLKLLVSRGGSDLFITAEFPPAIKVDGAIGKVSPQALTPSHTLTLARSIMSDKQAAEFERTKECNFAISPAGVGRFRVNAFIQQGRVGMVLRVIPLTLPTIDGLGVPQVLKEVTMAKRGLCILVGATGSGKSTTLAAMVDWRNEHSFGHIITVEDPVEYRLEGITQIETKEQIGLTFGSALRSVLRQDPDIVLIGEIRDEETADIAIKFSLTGHLVFSTLHANDAASTVTRLIDIGIKPYLVGSSLSLVMAQRLVRKICSYCVTDYKPTEQEISDCGLTPEEAAKINFKIGRGCVHCDNTGFSGRTGIFELLTVNPEIRSIIYDGGNQDLVRDAALRAGMRTLHDAAMAKMVKGVTTIREVIKMTIVD